MERLTTLEVKKRLEEAELKKLTKLNMPKGPLGRSKKVRETTPSLEVDIEDILILEGHVPPSDTSDGGYNDVPLDTFTNEIEYEPVVWASIKTGIFVLVDVIGGTRKKSKCR